ncbi:MAG: glycoside hydrolase family 97 N-terminal domain-containing protein [Dysgonomonas sp.]
MKNNIFFLIIIGLSLCGLNMKAQKQFSLKSPDGKIEANIAVGNVVTYQVSHESDLILEKSPLSMTLVGGSSYGINPKLTKSSTKTVNQTIDAIIYKKNKIADNYNELTLIFKGDYNII